MKHLVLAAIASLLEGAAVAATIQSFEVSEDKSHLSIHLASGAVLKAPLTDAEQEGFSNVQVSPNRKLIGWTATFPNCCTSYPLPRALVVHDGFRVVRIIGGESLSIFDWHFAPDSRSLIFKRELPHGASPQLFRWLRISDGKLLSHFDCVPPDPEHPPDAYRRPPKWTGATDEECSP